jgi:hypothetical protein
MNEHAVRDAEEEVPVPVALIEHSLSVAGDARDTTSAAPWPFLGTAEVASAVEGPTTAVTGPDHRADVEGER